MNPALTRNDYAVVGNPINHSLSPRIHAGFAQQTGLEINYTAIEIPIGSFASRVRLLQQQGVKGLNVTVPFKQEAWELCDHLSDRAADAAAVNTLSLLADGSIRGDNTDGAGLVTDLLDNLQFTLDNKRILLLGAGGAVHGVLGPILAQSPAEVTIANRTPEKAFALARDFANRGTVQALAYSDLEAGKYDLIINGTAAGLTNDLPPIPAKLVSSSSLCYDMMYQLQAATAFVAWSRSNGAASACDGLGMLVEQAAESFHVWHNIRPDTAPIISALQHL